MDTHLNKAEFEAITEGLCIARASADMRLYKVLQEYREHPVTKDYVRSAVEYRSKVKKAQRMLMDAHFETLFGRR